MINDGLANAKTRRRCCRSAGPIYRTVRLVLFFSLFFSVKGTKHEISSLHIRGETISHSLLFFRPSLRPSRARVLDERETTGTGSSLYLFCFPFLTGHGAPTVVAVHHLHQFLFFTALKLIQFYMVVVLTFTCGLLQRWPRLFYEHYYHCR